MEAIWSSCLFWYTTAVKFHKRILTQSISKTTAQLIRIYPRFSVRILKIHLDGNLRYDCAPVINWAVIWFRARNNFWKVFQSRKWNESVHVSLPIILKTKEGATVPNHTNNQWFERAKCYRLVAISSNRRTGKRTVLGTFHHVLYHPINWLVRFITTVLQTNEEASLIHLVL